MGIDFVVPMVFPEDVLWQQDFKRCNSTFIDKHVRWRSWGTERHLIRLVKRNMPWISNIYVLLARKSQLQYWMNEEGVSVVYHKDFIPEIQLPLFNSQAIEMFLHNIKGLSEQFVYANDDMYPLSPLKETDFFVDGKPCIRMMECQYPEKPNIFQKGCMNGLNFVGREFGKHFTTTWLKNGHSFAPMLKKTCEHLWEIGRNDIEMSITSFRSECNYNQYIYSWWQYLSGEYVDKVPDMSYIDVRGMNSASFRHILKESKGIICVNDNNKIRNYRIFANILKEELERRLKS